MNAVNNWIFNIGQRDAIAQLAAYIRKNKDIKDAVSEYLKPYNNWDTVNWVKEIHTKAEIPDNLQYDLGIVDVVNKLRLSRDNIENYCIHLFEQYDLHYEGKGKDVVKNPHVQWVLTKNLQNSK